MFGRNKKKKAGKQGLDVKARTKTLRALRTRMAVGAFAISSGLICTLFVVWKGGEWLLDNYVYTNPTFAIEQLEIQTDGIIPPEQLRRWANIRKGDNLLALDLNRIKRNLEMVPLIEAASVERYLPRKLIIRVAEREPIARVITFQAGADGFLESSAFYLDYQGMVIPPYARALNQQAFDRATSVLPNLTGVNPEDIRPGIKTTRPAILTALNCLREFERSEMAGKAEVRSIDITNEESLTLRTGQGNEIVLAAKDFRSQLGRWQKVHDYGVRHSKVLASLDLVVTNYVPAVWVEVTNTPSSAVRPPKSSPYRKKHV